jgi:hypothetical protein
MSGLRPSPTAALDDALGRSTPPNGDSSRFPCVAHPQLAAVSAALPGTAGQTPESSSALRILLPFDCPPPVQVFNTQGDGVAWKVSGPTGIALRCAAAQSEARRSAEGEWRVGKARKARPSAAVEADGAPRERESATYFLEKASNTRPSGGTPVPYGRSNASTAGTSNASTVKSTIQRPR